MKLPIYQADAFTGQLFTGNPAAVIFCGAWLSDEVMQAVALENNLSETAFVVGTGNQFEIRWFTPSVEVNLCGHATLAAAHVIFNHLACRNEVISFSSKSGLLNVRRDGEILYLDFPADSISKVDPPKALIDGFQITPREVYRGRDDFLVIVENENDVLSLDPDMDLILKVPSHGVIVSGPGDEADFVSRFFAPQSGVPEDPVTGSAHTTLVPYWSKRLAKRQLFARQLSRRGGELMCTDLDSRVEIGGRAVTYLVGEISVENKNSYDYRRSTP